jgi:glycosyltransferase involved in cell wall biosynthesis
MISIIIPTLNEKGLIRKSLEQFKEMKKTPHEIIISDGRSTDETVAIAREYTDKVVIYEGKERQTIANGRNLGATSASGEHLVFIDSDVIIPDPDNFFEKALKIFEKDKFLLAITASIKIYPEDETFSDKIFSWIVNITHRINNNLLKKGSASGEFQIIRREAFKKAGGFNDLLVTYEDNDMFERLAKIGKTRMIKELTIFHSGRRAHKIGWPKLMCIWIYNAIYFYLFKKAASKEWKPIR